MKSPLLYSGLLLVVALFAALIGPLFVDWSNYRSDLEAYGERVTGRKVLINGDITVRLLPAPILKVADIRVSNPEGAASPHLLIAKELEATLGLAPLLRGKIEVRSIDVDSPVIEAELLPDGGTWQLSPQGGFEKLLAVDDIELEDTRIRSGTLVVRDSRRQHLARFEELDMSLQAPSLAGPFKSRGTFLYNGTRKQFIVSVGRRRQDKPTHLSVTVAPGAGWGKNYLFNGTLLNKDGEPVFEGRVRVTEADASPGDAKQDKVNIGLAEEVPFELRSNVVATLDDIKFDEMQFILGTGSSRATLGGEARLDLGETPKLDAKLSARHLDLDSVVKRQLTEDEQREETTAREIVAQIPRFLTFVPKNLSGQLKMDVDGLVIGGQQIEGAGMTLRFTPDRFTVSRAVGRLPGQTQVSVTGTYAATEAGEGKTIFDGIFAVESSDAKSFITWALPKTMPLLNPQAGGARGNLSLKGELKVSEALVELIGVETTLDKTKARFGLSYALTARPSFGLRIILDELNVDRYLPPASRRAAASKEAETEEAKKKKLEDHASRIALLEEFDANIVARADKILIKGTGLRGMTADLTLRGGNLAIKDLSFTDFGGARIRSSGELNNVVAKPSGSIKASFDADDPTNILALFDVRPSEFKNGSAWVQWAQTLGPATLTAQLSADSSGDEPDIKFSAAGQFGQSRASFEGRYEGFLDKIAAAKVKFQAEVANEKGDELLRQLGIAASAAKDDKAKPSPGVLRGEFEGSLAEGLEVALGVEAFGAQATVSGNARQIAGLTSIEGEVKLSAKEAGPFYQAVGLASGGDLKFGGPLNLRALVAGKDGEYVVTGLTGSVADVAVDVDGTVDIRNDIPKLRFNANLAEVSLPWAMGVLLRGDRGGGTISRAVEAIESAGVGAAIWSPAPFGAGNLTAIELDLSAEVGRLKIGPDKAIRKAKLKAAIKGGRAELSSLNGRLFGGELTASGAITARRDQIQLEASHKIDKSKLSETLAFGGSETPIEGVVGTEGKWRSQGRSMLALLSSMSGTGTIKLSDMRLQGLNTRAFSTALSEARTEEQIDEVANSVLSRGATDIGSVATQYTIESGLVRLDPAEIQGADVKGRVTTKLDLPAWRMDSEWRLSFNSLNNAPPLVLVFAGPVGDVARTVDTRDLKAFLTVKALQEDMEKLEELERRAREELEKARQRQLKLESETPAVAPQAPAPPEPVNPEPSDSANVDPAAAKPESGIGSEPTGAETADPDLLRSVEEILASPEPLPGESEAQTPAAAPKAVRKRTPARKRQKRFRVDDIRVLPLEPLAR